MNIAISPPVGLGLLALLEMLLAVILSTPVQAAPPAGLRVVGDDNYPPFLFRDPDGRAVGYVADWWALWAQKTGVKVELNATLWAEAQRIINRGDAEVIDNMFRTPGREPLYDFTAPYATVPAHIFAQVSISGVHDVRSLRGFLVGVMEGDACVEFLQRNGIANLRFYPSYAALIDAALADDVKLFCLDEYPANYYLYRANAQKDFRKAFQLYQGQFHRAVRKGDLETLRLVERGAAAISAAEDAALRARWMPSPPVDYDQYARWLAWILATLAVIALALGAWIASLRVVVRRRTAELRASEQVAQNGEERFRQLCQELERRVAERTAELADMAASLRRANAEQQAILESATSGIVWIKNRMAVRCNRRMHTLLGWPEGALISQSTRVWYPDEAAYERASREAWAEIARGLIHRREQLLVRRDGATLWTRMTGHAIDATDPEHGSVWVIDDITAERAVIEELCKARQLAEAAARLKADFVANMSHEIRTPMNAIIGLTHLALRTELAPRQRDYLEKIQSSSQHLLNIINDVLDFSKLEAGKLAMERHAFDLITMLDEVIGAIAAKAAAKGLELILTVPEEVPKPLIGDPRRLGQALLNLVNNAVKFTQRGEIAIRVAVAEAGDRDVVLQFSVRDTGIGLSEEDRGRLFRSFVQADASTTRQHGGSGLGLVITQRLAELMGGDVGVDSAPGVGSTFWFTARLRRGPTPAPLHLPEPDRGEQPRLAVDNPDAARMPPGQTVDATATVDEAQWRELCRQLATHLQDYDLISRQFLEEHEPLLRSRLGERFAEIAQAIHEYDLPLALERLQEAIANHGD